MSFVKPKRYSPGPGDPELPPQLSEFHNKTSDEVLEELNRMPFFMTKLDGTDGEGGENVELEALKALAYDGEPDEIATNFKNQGNELFKVKRLKDARTMYTKGIEVNCDDTDLKGSLYLNRAACELGLKNYRRCINDCRAALSYNSKNPKAFYRLGKAFLALSHLKEANESISFGLAVNPDNQALKDELALIRRREDHLNKIKVQREEEIKKKEELKSTLEAAMAIRNIDVIKSSKPSELIQEAKMGLEDPKDIESQLIFPALVLYPTTGEFDFIASVSELNTPADLITMLLQRPKEWFEQKGHENFSAKLLVAYMETRNGGLIKAGKKVTFHDVLKMEEPKIPLFDNALKIYLVPKSESDAWLKKWNKDDALSKRMY